MGVENDEKISVGEVEGRLLERLRADQFVTKSYMGKVSDGDVLVRTPPSAGSASETGVADVDPELVRVEALNAASVVVERVPDKSDKTSEDVLASIKRFIF